MRTRTLENLTFLEGLLVGAAAFGVAFLVIGAARRRSTPALVEETVIDGVRPPPTPALDARPQPEANATPRLLESEAPDVPVASQRW